MNLLSPALVAVRAVPPVGAVALVLGGVGIGVDGRTMPPPRTVAAVLTPNVPGAEAVARAVAVILAATGAAILPRAVASLVLVAVRAVVLPEGATAAAETRVTMRAAAGVRTMMVSVRAEVRLLAAFLRWA